eukprot:TRINITY_DN2767_c0_g1_i1.p1 TRINITY_DN2767_c0_g1~~TRINITY_DN2767_c0_g1_i1.p1  ORF type:complete len:178 (+),score=7.93 TRINITY_DN2767_c0_g1_i1:115-648(+)
MGEVLSSHPEFDEVIFHSGVSLTVAIRHFTWSAHALVLKKKSPCPPNSPANSKVSSSALKTKLLVVVVLKCIGTRIVTLLPRKLLKIINEAEHLFKIYVKSQTHENESFYKSSIRSWIMKAKDKESFDDWVRNIRKAYRPRWVDKSASQCWLCERPFSFCWRQHHCRACGVVMFLHV